MSNKFAYFIFGLSFFSSLCHAMKTMTDGEVRDLIIRGSISANAEGCPCPYTMNNRQQACGDNSLYMQSSGAIQCYHSDITDEDVLLYRRENNIEKPKLPWDIDSKPES